MRLSINNSEVSITTADELRRALSRHGSEQFLEVWLNVDNGPSICAHMNRDVGWVMYLRENGDPGFSSRNPALNGTEKKLIEFELSNGQMDEYPGSWTFSKTQCFEALNYFLLHQARTPLMEWHDDSQ